MERQEWKRCSVRENGHARAGERGREGVGGAEHNHIIGQGGKESENDESGRKYTSRIDLSTQVYKLDEIKVEMKNGVLKVWVPKGKKMIRKMWFK